MLKRLVAVWLSLAGLACAQTPSAKAPESYSATYVSAIFGPSVTMKVDRDGSQAVIESTLCGQADGTAGDHLRTYYDLKKQHENYTLALE